MEMINLLKETLDILSKNHKTPQDVEWCGNKQEHFSWNHFEKIANIEYDNDFGINEICSDLLVVGKNWWLERNEYDGREWWEYKKLPIRPAEEKLIDSVFCGCLFENKQQWQNLNRDIN